MGKPLHVFVNSGQMKNTIEPFIGKSAFSNEVRDLINTLSKNTASLLLVGERGSGKRFLARHIHFAANQNFGCFVEMNCRTLTKQQMYFSFETISQILKYNQPVTFFVAQIDCLQSDLQNDLLALIKKYKDSNERFRIISSTETSLEDCVADGTFLKDLYYKLNAVVLNVLPLRQRREDIIPLAEFYLSVFKKRSGLVFESFSDEAIDFLYSGFFAGNIDELVNCIQRAFIVGKPPVISASDLGLTGLSQIEKEIAQTSDSDKTLKAAVDRFKKEYITRILEENGWNQTKSAQILGIQRTYVIKLINELNIRK